MLKKISLDRFLSFLSFLFAFVSLAFFSFYKIPFLLNFVSNEINKNLVFLSLSVLAILFYLITLIGKREVLFIKNKILRISFFVFPLIILLSTIFSYNFNNAMFGKYVFLQSGATLIGIIFSAFIVVSYFKFNKRISWSLLTIGSLFVTLPVILALIFSKFGMVVFASKLVYFVESWDIVSVVASILVILSLLYFETIAYTRGQKILSAIVVFLHLALLTFIIIPDIWYALALSSLFILIFSRDRKIDTGIAENKKSNPFYKKLSLYVFLFSSIFSILFLFSRGPTAGIVNNFSQMAGKVSGISYSFIKPTLGLSTDLAFSQIKEGRLFGTGPAEFYKAWQKDKSQSVIDSPYWGVDFSSSFSALTTFAVTLGIIGFIALISFIIFVIISLYRVFKKKSQLNELTKDDESKFYFLASVVMFIFSLFLLIFFVNIILAFVLFSLFSAIVLSQTLKMEEVKVSNLYILFVFAIFLVSLIALIISFNKIRSTYIINNSLTAYRTDANLENLEKGLLKASRVSREDNNYRLLSQFYLFKTRLILDTASTTDVEALQKEVLTAINNSITSAKTAVSLDTKDYNNYLSLGGVYSFLMSIDQQNKEESYVNAKNAYNTAISLYPKNPSLFLTLADLEYAYNQKSPTIVDTIKKSLEVKPNYSSAYYLFSQLAIQNNDRDTALEFARQAIVADPQNVDAYLQFGILLLNKQNLTGDELNQAYTAFVTALALDGTNTVAAYHLAVTYILAGEYDKASELVRVLDELLPNNANILELKNTLRDRGENVSPVVEGATTTPTTN